jgi:hypothetical protein
MTNRQAVDGGWMEALFQRQPKPFRQLEEIKEENYELIGSAMPRKELSSPYDFYVMLHHRQFDGAPRAPVHGDVLNICLSQEIIRSYLLVNPAVFKSTMTPGSYNDIEIKPGYPLGMQRLPQRFGSFVCRGKTT